MTSPDAGVVYKSELWGARFSKAGSPFSHVRGRDRGAGVLLRNEYITRGYPSVPDSVLVEIVDEVYLPLVRGRGMT
jgi:hypothetical protein